MVEDFNKLQADTRTQHRPTLATPLRKQAGDLDDEASRLRRQKLDVDVELNQAKRKQQESERQDATIAKREQEVKAGKESLDRYVGTLATRLSGPPLDTSEWGTHAKRIPELALEWVFTSAIAQVKQHGGQWAAKLLDYLAVLKQQLQANPEDPGHGGPWVEVIGNTKLGEKEAGLSQVNLIQVSIDMPGTNLLRFLTSEDGETRAAREKLVTETASTFIHEAAHLRQYRIYKNASYPWTPHQDFGGLNLAQRSNKGAQYANWTEDVKSAFDEFGRGGTKGQAQGDPDRKRFFDALHAKEYYDPTSRIDERASELVSHLLELVYAWRDEQKFRGVFPECAKLLDRVITQGAAAPGT